MQDIVDNNLSEIELSAYITASYIHNLDSQETEWLTRAMIETGERIHFDTHPVMDKHSIGGVPGNKVSLLVVPIVAAAGLLIPKTSSRAITGAGGTADLMEVLAPVEFSADEIKEITESVGGVIVGGGATNIAPADDKLIKAVDRKAFAVHLDPCNAVNSPLRFYRNTDLLNECFDVLGRWIVSCHAKDLKWEVEMNIHFVEVRPGAGSMDYATYLRRLAGLSHDAPLMLEHLPNAEEYDRARAHLF